MVIPVGVGKGRFGLVVLGHVILQGGELFLNLLRRRLPVTGRRGDVAGGQAEVHVAIGARVLLQVFLVVLLGRVEIGQRQHLGDHRFLVPLLHLGKDGTDDREVLRVPVVNAGTVLGAHVVPLAVAGSGVNDLEKILEKLGQAYHFRVIYNVDGFRMPGSAGTDLFISGVFRLTIGVAGGCCHYAADPGEIGLHTPKTPAGQPDFLAGFIFITRCFTGVYRQNSLQDHPPLSVSIHYSSTSSIFTRPFLFSPSSPVLFILFYSLFLLCRAALRTGRPAPGLYST